MYLWTWSWYNNQQTNNLCSTTALYDLSPLVTFSTDINQFLIHSFPRLSSSQFSHLNGLILGVHLSLLHHHHYSFWFSFLLIGYTFSSFKSHWLFESSFWWLFIQLIKSMLQMSSPSSVLTGSSQNILQDLPSNKLR